MVAEEGYVEVSEGSGKKLRTRTQTIGENEVHEEVVMNYTLEDYISLGLISGAKVVHKFGLNEDVDNAWEDLWSLGGSYVFPSAGMQMELVSTSDEDSGDGGVNPAGTGVRTVEIHYLDTEYAEQIEVVALDGTATVTTSAENILRVNGFHSQTTGTSKAAIGEIDLRNLADTPIYARIEAEENRAQQPFYTVPAGKKFYLKYWTFSEGTNAKWTSFELIATSYDGETPIDGVFFVESIGNITEGKHSQPLYPIYGYPAQTDIKIRVRCKDSNANASAGFRGVLLDA